MIESRRYPWEYQGDRLVIETPEQTRLEFRVAPFGSRIGAALIDNLLLSAVSLVVVLFLSMIPAVGSSGWFAAIVLIAWFLVSLFYFVVAEVWSSGRTLGKRLLGLRTIMATGHGVTPGASLIRNLARVVDNIPLFWLVPALTQGSRRCGDLLAGTFVIDERPSRDVRPGAWLTRLAPTWQEIPDRRFALGAQHARQLHPDDLNLIEYLETRMRSMPGRTRRKAMKQIAERYVERLGMQDQAERVDEDPARFLQELGLFLRSRFDEQAY